MKRRSKITDRLKLKIIQLKDVSENQELELSRCYAALEEAKQQIATAITQRDDLDRATKEVAAKSDLLNRITIERDAYRLMTRNLKARMIYFSTLHRKTK